MLCLSIMNTLISSSFGVSIRAKVKYNYFKMNAIDKWVGTLKEIVFPALHVLSLICFLFNN